MIRVESLRYSYPPTPPDRARRVVLDGLSFAVEVGRCLAVTGANGCGKSTLCLAVAGLAPRLTGGRLDGHISVAGRDVQRQPTGTLADVIGLVMQDPAGQLFNSTIEDEVAWGLENLGLPPAEMPERIERALALAGLTHVPRTQPPQTLSGGEQKRLALASALALAPRVLILDEPAGGLAPAARAEMVAVLKRLRAEESLTILLAENDPQVIAALADEVILLADGRIAQRGAPRAFYAALHRCAFPGVAVPPAIVFAQAVAGAGGPTSSPLTAAEAAEQLRGFDRPPDLSPNGRRGSSHRPASEGSAIKLEGVAFAYDPSRPVLRDLSLAIPRGQFVALVGDNGAGKTTLARHLIGLLRPARGTVRVLGEDAAGLSIGQLARRVGFAFQNPELQIFSPTVREEVAFGPRNLGLSGPALDAAVKAALDRFALRPLADHPPAALTFSARRMVALASIAAMNTPILVLDEPTVGLDAAHTARVMDWLGERRAAGTTVLLITHDMDLAARADRALVMLGGRIAADGPPPDVFFQVATLREAGLEPPFAVQLALEVGYPALAADLTPQGAARAWVEAARWKRVESSASRQTLVAPTPGGIDDQDQR